MKIKLLADLPIEDKHGAREGRIFEVTDVDHLKPLSGQDKGRTDKYHFVGDAGETCCAYLHEAEKQ